jgi:hypothetical protein
MQARRVAHILHFVPARSRFRSAALTPVSGPDSESARRLDSGSALRGLGLPPSALGDGLSRRTRTGQNAIHEILRM